MAGQTREAFMRYEYNRSVAHPRSRWHAAKFNSQVIHGSTMNRQSFSRAPGSPQGAATYHAVLTVTIGHKRAIRVYFVMPHAEPHKACQSRTTIEGPF